MIADSGSTKTHWVIPGHLDIETTGINPFYLGAERIAEILKQELKPHLPDGEISDVYFYGAGISQADKQQIVEEALRDILPNATLHIDHDLLAAARATCGKQPGITCILGTGSNSCLFDGEEITDNIPSLGFILGDEGSGASMGRNLLKAYYYRDMPADLRQKLEAWRDMSKSTVLNKIYGAEKPNEHTARYFRFIADHADHIFIQRLLVEEFTTFIRKNVLKYAGCKDLPVHFIGSVAYLNQQLLTGILHTEHLTEGLFLKDPMEGLITFHSEA